MASLVEHVRAKNGGVLSPEDEKLLVGMEEVFNKKLENNASEIEQRNSKALEEAIKETIGTMPIDKDGKKITLMEQLRSMAENVDKVEKASRRTLSNEEKYNLRKSLEQNKEAIREAIHSDSPKEVKIAFDALRAPQMMTTQNVVTGAPISTGMNLEWDKEIAFIKYPDNFVLDIIRSRQVSKVPQVLIKREQSAREGQAVVTPEGDVKQLVSYEFEDKMYNRIKIAAHMEWTEEFENDFESLFYAIIDLFERDLLRDWQNILLDKIIATAPPYVSSPLDGTIPYPNIYSVIGAGISSIQSLDGAPTVIKMNPSTLWAMNLAQDSTGQVIVPPIMVGSNQIAGIRVYTSTAIDPNKILIGQGDTWREQHTGFISRIGLINDQLIRNEKTIVGEVFSLMYQAVRDQGSWIYLDIPTVMAALQKPAA